MFILQLGVDINDNDNEDGDCCLRVLVSDDDEVKQVIVILSICLLLPPLEQIYLIDSQINFYEAPRTREIKQR